jgi:hypothetical protein
VARGFGTTAKMDERERQRQGQHTGNELLGVKLKPRPAIKIGRPK